MKRILLIYLFCIICIISACNIMESVNEPARLAIHLKSNQIAKSSQTLEAVECRIKKGSTLIYKEYLDKDGDYFNGEIHELDPHDNYAVILYGFDSENEIITRCAQSEISLDAGEEKDVYLSWKEFSPDLIKPYNKGVLTTYSPEFSWHEVDGAHQYDLIIFQELNSSCQTIVRDSSINSETYIPDIKHTNVLDATNSTLFYWRVRVKDSEAVWGNWSATRSFSIQLNRVTVISPNGGEVWTTGSNEEIEWASSFVGQIRIKLYHKSDYVRTIADLDASAGSYAWTIPDNINPSEYYRIRVFSESVSSIGDYSDTYFTIREL